VCSICSSEFGNEGHFFCAEHSTPQETDATLIASDESINKTFATTVMVNRKVDVANKKVDATNRKMDVTNKKVDEEKKKKERGVEYSATEVLLLSKAWILASENSLVGVHQKMNTFWESVLQRYNVFKQQHDDYMVREKEKDNFRIRNLNRAAFMEENIPEVAEDVPLLPVRNVGSLQQKWSKKVQPLIIKFIGVMKRYPKRSGEDAEAYYNRVHIIFLKENPGEKSFDLYRPGWEYLVDKPKFCITNELPSSRKREVISLEDGDDPDTAAIKVLPMGRNSTKCKLEAEKILASVSKQIEAEKNTTTSSYLAGALQEIAKCVGSAIFSWHMQSAIPDASAHLQRQYYDAIVKKYLLNCSKRTVVCRPLRFQIKLLRYQQMGILLPQGIVLQIIMTVLLQVTRSQLTKVKTFESYVLTFTMT
jgi:hypothetical protein